MLPAEVTTQHLIRTVACAVADEEVQQLFRQAIEARKIAYKG
jgi:hypothetical protein